MRRATLRGCENLNERHQIAAACYNLSQLLRRLHGVGTPKQWLAKAGHFAFLASMLGIKAPPLHFPPPPHGPPMRGNR